MKMISAEQLQRLRETYPSGIRVELIRMEDMQAPLRRVHRALS